MGRVQDKVCLITGGTGGIGYSAAQLMCREGGKVAITDIRPKEGEAAAQTLRDQGYAAIFIEQDVTSESRWPEVIAAVVAEYGRLDVLVNNAGVGAATDLEESDLAHWRFIQSVNLESVFMGTQNAIKQMKLNGGGSIVNISSIEGIIGDPRSAAYNASKGGVRLFTKSAALYCAEKKYNIRVNSVHPGFTKTPMAESAGDLFGPDDLVRIQHEIVIGHMAEPQDQGYGVLYLASDESKYVTGTELIIDGGYTCH
ncbi:MAG: 3-beta hydroxysteroid dehydrogenase [Gammaproteobacteria bacterium]|nr:MAG: 3-beta hydroxysteroid dehydrogenase [Gammaproteobacteria bacterium]